MFMFYGNTCALYAFIEDAAKTLVHTVARDWSQQERSDCWLLTLFILHGTMQMTLKGLMRRKQRGNEQR